MSESTAPRTKRQLVGDASRAEILDAASRLMSAKGYDGTSMSLLSKECGLPVSSIYWHFSSKEGVLAAVMERGAAAFFADLPSREELLATEPPRERLRQALKTAGQAVSEHPEFLRLFIILLLRGGPEPRGEDDVVRRVREVGRDQLRAALEVTFADEEPKAVAAMSAELVDIAQGMFDGAFLATQYDPGLSQGELMDQMADALLALAHARLGST